MNSIIYILYTVYIYICVCVLNDDIPVQVLKTIIASSQRLLVPAVKL